MLVIPSCCWGPAHEVLILSSTANRRCVSVLIGVGGKGNGGVKFTAHGDSNRRVHTNRWKKLGERWDRGK